MGRYNGNLRMVKKKIMPLTLRQLKKWNVKFNKLLITKPSADIYIDDKSYGYSKKWQKSFAKYMK